MLTATMNPRVRCAASASAAAEKVGGRSSGPVAPRHNRRFAQIAAWLPLLVLPVVAVVESVGTSPWVQMLSISVALLAGLKWLSWRTAVARGSACGRGRSIGYLLAWPGMDARVFLDPHFKANDPTRREWLLAMAKILLGAALVWGLAGRMMPVSILLAGWIGIAGFLALLHFGVFELLSLAWRTAGVEAAPIMRQPWAARSLSEFWGQRWNLAFRQVAFDCVYRPLIRPLGARLALVMVFVFSALLHELVISLPAHGGYGLPSLYFLLQGAGVMAARSAWGRRIGIDHGPRARAFAWLLVAGAAPLLFHELFVTRVIGSLLITVGAA
jgi:hypothetical protein